MRSGDADSATVEPERAAEDAVVFRLKERDDARCACATDRRHSDVIRQPNARHRRRGVTHDRRLLGEVDTDGRVKESRQPAQRTVAHERVAMETEHLEFCHGVHNRLLQRAEVIPVQQQRAHARRVDEGAAVDVTQLPVVHEVQRLEPRQTDERIAVNKLKVLDVVHLQRNKTIYFTIENIRHIKYLFNMSE